jgi:hypothetical protein
MKSRPVVVIFLGLVTAILVWTFAFLSPRWVAQVTEPLFIFGTLLEIALTPGHNRTPDLVVIVLGYAVNFLITWALMASLVGLLLRFVSKRRGVA